MNDIVNESSKKKIIISSIIAVMILVLATAGATYAYFVATTTNELGNVLIHTETQNSKVIFFNEQTISMRINNSNMLDAGSDVTYYAPGGNSTTPTTTPTTINLATVATTGTGTYSCNYTLYVTADSNGTNTYDAFQTMTGKSANQIVLTIDTGAGSPNVLDFNTANLFNNRTISGTFSNLTTNNAINITGQLMVVNKHGLNQSVLAGTDIIISVGIEDFECSD